MTRGGDPAGGFALTAGLDKLGLPDRSKAVAYAYATGLVRPDGLARPP